MPYPIVTRASARIWFNEWTESGKPYEPPESPEPGTSIEGEDHDWNALAASLIGTLDALYDAVEGKRNHKSLAEANDLVAMALGNTRAQAAKRLSNERFEAAASIIVRETLPRDVTAFADPEFWHWMATGPGVGLIRRCYPPKKGKSEFPGSDNFISPGAKETFFYRLWMRAELVYDASLKDPYELARCGDVDFWRSHVFRQVSMHAPALLVAFIRFQHPDGPDGDKRLNRDDIRELISLIRRAAANVLVEMLDEQEAKRFVENQWLKFQAQNS